MCQAATAPVLTSRRDALQPGANVDDSLAVARASLHRFSAYFHARSQIQIDRASLSTIKIIFGIYVGVDEGPNMVVLTSQALIRALSGALLHTRC